MATHFRILSPLLPGKRKEIGGEGLGPLEF